MSIYFSIGCFLPIVVFSRVSRVIIGVLCIVLLGGWFLFLFFCVVLIWCLLLTYSLP